MTDPAAWSLPSIAGLTIIDDQARAWTQTKEGMVKTIERPDGFQIRIRRTNSTNIDTGHVLYKDKIELIRPIKSGSKP